MKTVTVIVHDFTGEGASEAEGVLPVQQGRDTEEAEREGQDEAWQGCPTPIPGTLPAAAGAAVLSHNGAVAEDGF